MADLILHHYANSPFSEKVRVAFGIKQLAWKSVLIPNIMPKPDLMPLTGGYRKTPVMQVGADIYCDTQLIMMEIEKRAPKPPLLPVGQEGEARALAMWIDRNIFWSAVGVVMGAIGDQLPEAFKKDRTEFSGRPFDGERLKAAQPMAREQTYAQLTLAEQMLRDGRPFLLGAVPSLADCALYNPVWFLQVRMGAGATPSPLDRLPKIVEWSERMKAFGSGKPDRDERDRRARGRQNRDAGDLQGRRPGSERAEGRTDGQRHAGRYRQGSGHRYAGWPDQRPRVDHPQRRACRRRRRPFPARGIHRHAVVLSGATSRRQGSSLAVRSGRREATARIVRPAPAADAVSECGLRRHSVVLRACELFLLMSICWERGSPEPLMGCGNSKEERLGRAALPADECSRTHPIKTFTNSERGDLTPAREYAGGSVRSSLRSR